MRGDFEKIHGLEAFECKVWDGESPLPREASLTVDGQDVFLKFPDQAGLDLIRFSDIVESRETPEGLKLIVDRHNRDTANCWELLIEDPLFAAVWKRRLSAKVVSSEKLVQLPMHWILALVILIVPLFAWGTLELFSASYTLVPFSLEEKLGASINKSIVNRFGASEKKDLNLLLSSWVKRLQYDNDTRPVEVTIVKADINNAFALPGRKIVIFEGLINASKGPEEVMGILAHELSHIEKQHALQNIVRSLGTIFVFSNLVGGGFEELEFAETVVEGVGAVGLLKFSRELESEADYLALKKLSKAKVSARGLKEFFEGLIFTHTDHSVKDEEREETGYGKLERKLGWLSTHPVTKDRINLIQRHLDSESFDPEPLLPEGVAWESFQDKEVSE